MDQYIILHQVNLSAKHKPTGKTRHDNGVNECPAPALLQIVQYTDSPGCYLLYLSNEGKELTDTYHESIDKALAQAQWEFEIKPEEWNLITK